MKIINETKNLLGNQLFLVKGDEETIRNHFEMKYPNNDIGVLEHLTNLGTIEVCILPKETE
jgi:hypothetical protein